MSALCARLTTKINISDLQWFAEAKNNSVKSIRTNTKYQHKAVFGTFFRSLKKYNPLITFILQVNFVYLELRIAKLESVSGHRAVEPALILTKRSPSILTGWKPTQWALNIEQHLVVVLVVLPLDFFWDKICYNQNWLRRRRPCTN